MNSIQLRLTVSMYRLYILHRVHAPCEKTERSHSSQIILINVKLYLSSYDPTIKQINQL